MLMPAGAETMTIQLEQQTPSNSFLHLDLLPDNQVRIDDNETTKFATFPRDQPFIVQVTLDTTSTPKARFVVSGVGASGITDYTIQPSLQEFAHQFGAIRLWIGFPHIADYYDSTPRLRSVIYIGGRAYVRTVMQKLFASCGSNRAL